MKNPLNNQYDAALDLERIKKSLNGDKNALTELVNAHQPFIYNVAWKMCHDPNDAMDLTQETLIKVITKLSQFNSESSFRTWLYRIVVNEFLQAKRKKGEARFDSFDDHTAALDSIPSSELSIEEEITYKEISREMQIACMSGMLLCLNREQRLIYVLGETFGIDHNLGAEIFEMSPQNFRVKLHRARKELHNYMDNKCGLVNENNPCKCPKKAKSMKLAGKIDEKTMRFNISYTTSIAQYVSEEHNNIAETVNSVQTQLYRQHPTKEDFDKDAIVEHILKDDNLMSVFQLN